jgi:hypothetical protein
MHTRQASSGKDAVDWHRARRCAHRTAAGDQGVACVFTCVPVTAAMRVAAAAASSASFGASHRDFLARPFQLQRHQPHRRAVVLRALAHQHALQVAERRDLAALLGDGARQAVEHHALAAMSQRQRGRRFGLDQQPVVRLATRPQTFDQGPHGR